jgi:(p)ppGpp synthase/HD superfamily hydrolase
VGTALDSDGTRLTDRFASALAWAAELHKDQARKSKPLVPYISHPIGVASLVLADRGSEDEAIAGLLHDVVEDCGVSVDEIRRRYGDAVAAIVDGATDSLPNSDGRGKGDWHERKQRYLEHLEAADEPALRVGAADKLYNAHDIVADLRADGPGALEKFNQPEDVVWYYGSVVEILRARLPESMLTAELTATVADLVALVGEGSAPR